MMIGQRQLINKSFIMTKINKGFIMKGIEYEIDRLLRIIEKQDNKIFDLEYSLKISQKNRKELSIAYARKLGVIQTEKEYDWQAKFEDYDKQECYEELLYNAKSLRNIIFGVSMMKNCKSEDDENAVKILDEILGDIDVGLGEQDG